MCSVFFAAYLLPRRKNPFRIVNTHTRSQHTCAHTRAVDVDDDDDDDDGGGGDDDDAAGGLYGTNIYWRLVFVLCLLPMRSWLMMLLMLMLLLLLLHSAADVSDGRRVAKATTPLCRRCVLMEMT